MIYRTTKTFQKANERKVKRFAHSTLKQRIQGVAQRLMRGASAPLKY